MVFTKSVEMISSKVNVCSLESERGCLEEVAEIKDSIHEHFKKFFKEA